MTRVFQRLECLREAGLSVPRASVARISVVQLVRNSLSMHHLRPATTHLVLTIATATMSVIPATVVREPASAEATFEILRHKHDGT